MSAKILVVDDDPINRKAVAAALAKTGHEVVLGANGNEALARLREGRLDLIVMDVQMPGLGGREVCRIIKSTKSFGFIPVILMTSSDDVQAKVEGLEIGADDFLLKPLNWLELSARVKSMLRLKTLQDELVNANERLRDVNEHLEELSTTDALMGIYNRLFFQKRISYEFQRTQRYSKPLSLLIMDLDHFKQINDQYGHLFGDLVLKQVAEMLRQTVRQVDILARYGGEEIVVICPETDSKGAMILAERIRSSIEAREFGDEQQKTKLTVSLGLVEVPNEKIHDVSEMLRVADEALYRAKSAGRNCFRNAFSKD
jgi:two-component system cell cycle response regulator